MMRLTLMSTALVLSISGALFAQDWRRVCQPGGSLHVQLPESTESDGDDLPIGARRRSAGACL